MVVRFLATKVLPAVAVTSAAVTIYSSSAHAFFPPVPIGSDQVITPPTTSPQSPLPPPVSPPPIPPLPPPVSPPPPPVSPPPPPPVVDPCDPQHVPEPATIATGLIGLSLLGAGALKKKFGKK